MLAPSYAITCCINYLRPSLIIEMYYYSVCDVRSCFQIRTAFWTNLIFLSDGRGKEREKTRQERKERRKERMKKGINEGNE